MLCKALLQQTRQSFFFASAGFCSSSSFGAGSLLMFFNWAERNTVKLVIRQTQHTNKLNTIPMTQRRRSLWFLAMLLEKNS